MRTYNNLFKDELVKLVQEEIARATEVLVSGNLPDLQSYTRHSGYIAALRWTLEACEEIDTKISNQ